jgi:hypothetical protein
MKRLAGLAFILVTAMAGAMGQTTTPSLGTIYICHNTHASEWGSNHHILFEVDGVELGNIPNHSYIQAQVPAGRHQIHVLNYPKGALMANKVLAETATIVTVAPGKTTYVEAVFKLGHGGGSSIDVSEVYGFENGLKPQPLPASLVGLLETTHLLQAEQHQPTAVAELTDADIEDAILKGNYNVSPSAIGLRLNDVQTNVLSHTLTPDYAVSGFTVLIYTPKQWIEYNAALAHKHMRPFGPGDVTQDMRSSLLHVVALPSTPDSLNARNMSAASGVSHIVVCDNTRKIIIQPVVEQSHDVITSSALRDANYISMAAAFNTEEVKQLLGQGQDEWYIVVVGANDSRKFFKVKSKFDFKL